MKKKVDMARPSFPPHLYESIYKGKRIKGSLKFLKKAPSKLNGDEQKELGLIKKCKPVYSYEEHIINDNSLIKVKENQEIISKLKKDCLTEEQQAMILDLVIKDPNFYSILNHCFQKFHHYPAQIEFKKQHNSEEKPLILVNFSLDNIFVFKTDSEAKKSSLKQVVSERVLTFLFPQVIKIYQQALDKIKGTKDNNDSHYTVVTAKQIPAKDKLPLIITKAENIEEFFNKSLVMSPELCSFQGSFFDDLPKIISVEDFASYFRKFGEFLRKEYKRSSIHIQSILNSDSEEIEFVLIIEKEIYASARLPEDAVKLKKQYNCIFLKKIFDFIKNNELIN